MNDWISVEDDLPEFKELVWFLDKDQCVNIGFRHAYKGNDPNVVDPHEYWYSIEDEWWVSGCFQNNTRATHWMKIHRPNGIE